MSGASETPRQKMIGMMYLVLTALLALNVSKDILDAFIVVNNGLENTNKNFTKRNDELYAEFNLAKSIDPVRVSPNREKAQNVKKQSVLLTAYIEEIKKRLIAETDGVPKNVADTMKMANISSKDNYDIPTNIMIGNTEDGANGTSRQLKNKLMDFKKLLTGYILPVDRKKVEININTEDPPKNENNENWETYNFSHRPLVASITILSKLSNDVKNAEATTVDYLLKLVDEGSLKFDTVAAKVVPQSNYVLLGEEYKADLFLAAFNKTKNPEIEVGKYNENTHQFEGAASKIHVERGLGKYNVRTSREGIMTYSGTVKVVAPSGKEVVFPFKSEYIVARPALTVSVDKMNVFYPGLENPVSVSVPGIPNERLSVSISNGSITPTGGGHYNVKVTNPGSEATISVAATMENGEKRNMGSSVFRIKSIPKPFAKFAGQVTDGSLSKVEVGSNAGLIAFYDNFVYNATCKVTSFNVTVISSTGIAEDYPQTSNLFDQKTKIRFDKLKRGDKIMFNQITAVGPDNRTVPLNGLLFKVR